MEEQERLAQYIADDIKAHHVEIGKEAEYGLDTSMEQYGLDSLALVEAALRLGDGMRLPDMLLHIELADTPNTIADKVLTIRKGQENAKS